MTESALQIHLSADFIAYLKIYLQIPLLPYSFFVLWPTRWGNTEKNPSQGKSSSDPGDPASCIVGQNSAYFDCPPSQQQLPITHGPGKDREHKQPEQEGLGGLDSTPSPQLLTARSVMG